MTTRRLLAAVPLALAGWIAVLALVMRLGGPAPAALVVGAGPDLLARLPDGIALTDANALGLTVAAAPGGPAHLVAALYAAGAPLVLPAGLAGCLGLSG